MRPIHCFSLLIVLSASALPAQPVTGKDWGVLRYAQQEVNIRAARTTESAVVGKLLAGQRVKADFLANNWFAVFPPSETRRSENLAVGYVLAPLLKPTHPAARVIRRSPTALRYRVVGRQDVSHQGANRMAYRVVTDVREIPVEPAICEVAKAIWRAGNTRWDVFTVWIYLPTMDTEGLAYVTAEFGPDGLLDFKVEPAALLGTKWEIAKRPPSDGCGS